MGYFAAVTSSNPVLYWTLQETGSGGPRWTCTDYGRYGYMSGTVSSSMRVFQVNMTGTIPLTASYYAPRVLYIPTGYPIWNSPVGQNPSGCLAQYPGYVGPTTGPISGSYVVKPELTATFQLSSSWSVEWWEANYPNNQGTSISFVGNTGSATVGFRFGWVNSLYNMSFELWWASGSTGSGSPPAVTGSRKFTCNTSTNPWPYPWINNIGQGGGGLFHFMLVWRGSGTLSGAINNGPNFDVWMNGVQQSSPTPITWTGTGEPLTGSQMWWTNSTFQIGALGDVGYYSAPNNICHVSVYDRAIGAEEVFYRYMAFANNSFSGSVSGLSGSGSFDIASGSFMIQSVQRPFRNLVPPSSGSIGGNDPRSKKTNAGTN